MNKFVKATLIAATLSWSAAAMATGYFSAPGLYGSVGISGSLCLITLKNNPYSDTSRVSCFSHAAI